MQISSVGIVGHGNFGSFLQALLERFAPEMQVKVFSRREKFHEPFYSLEEVAKCDAVILAVPIHALEDMIQKIVPLMSEKGILVDVSTVKKFPAGLLKKYAKGRNYIATHPMWGPESYKKKSGDVSGFRIVITDSTLQESDVDEFSRSLETLGFKVLRMTSDAHDKHLAETLFLTHYIGQIVSRAKFDRTEIDTVSFGYLMDAVESVKHDKALFEDVFRFNPYCGKTMLRFEKGESEVGKMLKKAKRGKN